jgi:hypothetical protein
MTEKDGPKLDILVTAPARSANTVPDHVTASHMLRLIVCDPDSRQAVELEVFKLSNGAIVGLDGSYVELDEPIVCPYDLPTGEVVKIHIPDDDVYSPRVVDLTRTEEAESDEKPLEFSAMQARDLASQKRKVEVEPAVEEYITQAAIPAITNASLEGYSDVELSGLSAATVMPISFWLQRRGFAVDVPRQIPDDTFMLRVSW